MRSFKGLRLGKVGNNMFEDFVSIRSEAANIEICERTLEELEKEKASIEKQIKRVSDELELYKKSEQLRKKVSKSY